MLKMITHTKFFKYPLTLSSNFILRSHSPLIPSTTQFLLSRNIFSFSTKKSLKQSEKKTGASPRKSNRLSVISKNQPLPQALNDSSKNKKKVSTPVFQKVDEATSLHNIQTLFMKCHELLPDEAIQEFIQKIDNSRSNLLTGGMAYAKKFLASCQSLFEKYDANELMDYLTKCRIEDIRTNMLFKTIFDFESQCEIKQKVDKFKAFALANQPDDEYIIDENEDNNSNRFDTHMSKPAEVSELNLIEKFSKLQIIPNISKKSQEDFSESANILNNIFDEAIPQDDLASLGGDKIEVVNDLEEKDLNVVNDLEVSKSIKIEENPAELYNDDIIDEAHNKINIFNSQGVNIKKISDQLKGKKAKKQNLLSFKLQGRDEIICLHQKGFDKKEITPTNWVYLYNLPYEIQNEQELHDEIAKSLNRYVGRIKNIKFFSFKNFLDIKPRSNQIKLYDNLDKIFNPLQLNEQKLLHSDLPVPIANSTQDIQVLNNQDQLNRKASGMKKLKKTERILESLKSKKNKKLDRSYALIEFYDYEAKQKALSPDLRLFGVSINGNICMIDDADYKVTLTCYNVHWATLASKFCSEINRVFEEKNMADLKFEEPSQNEDKMLTRFYMNLRFNSFYNTLRAMKALENMKYEQRELRIQHLYGCLKTAKGKYYEILDIETASAVLEKVQENKIKAKSKILSIPPEESYNSIPCPLDELPEIDFNTDIYNKKNDYHEGHDIVEDSEISEEELYTIDVIDTTYREAQDMTGYRLK